MKTTGNWEIDLSFAIVKIAEELERIGDALEALAYDDDGDGHDPSDGPFIVQESQELDELFEAP